MNKTKLLHLLLSTATTLGLLVACSNNTITEDNNTKGIATTIQIRASELKTRGVTDGQTDVDGVAQEATVKDGAFITYHSPTMTTPILSFASDGSNVWLSEATQYTGKIGTTKATLLLNANSSLVAALPTNPLKLQQHEVAIDNLPQLTAKTGFTMAAKTGKEIEIKSGIGIHNIGPQKNLFSFDVERLVSKVQVQAAPNIAIDPANNNLTSLVGYKNYTYSLAGSATKIYLFADHAGSRTIDPTTQKYTDFTSAIHTSPATTYEPDQQTEFYGNPSPSNDWRGTRLIEYKKVVTPRAELTKVSDLKLVAPFNTPADWATKNAYPVTVASNNSAQSITGGIYFLENSLDKDITDKDQLMFNDISYVKIYAQPNPKVLKWNEATQAFDEVAPYKSTDVNTYDDIQTDSHGNRIYEVVMGDSDYLYYDYIHNRYIMRRQWIGAFGEYEEKCPRARKTIPASEVENLDAQGAKNRQAGDKITTRAPEKDCYYFIAVDKPGTFYRGNNGKLYYSIRDAHKAGEVITKKYDGGRMVWMLPTNSQIVGTDNAAYTKYADTRRNNIYSLTITGITDFGTNYDPIDPTDPNCPKPINPFEPVRDEAIPVNPAKTNIEVKAEILNWNLSEQFIDLN